MAGYGEIEGQRTEHEGSGMARDKRKPHNLSPFIHLFYSLLSSTRRYSLSFCSSLFAYILQSSLTSCYSLMFACFFPVHPHTHCLPFRHSDIAALPGDDDAARPFPLSIRIM